MKARLPKGYGNGGANNIQQLARQAQKLQDDMEQASQELEAKEYTATSGGNGKVAGRACPAPTDCCFRNRGFGGAWRRTTSAASLLRKHARAVVCPAGANIARSPVSLRSTVAPRSQPRNTRI